MEFVFVSGPRLGERVEAGPEECLIGNQPDCHIVLQSGDLHPSTGEVRVLIRRQGQGWTVSPLEGDRLIVNQTWLTSSMPFRPGDFLRISALGPDLRFAPRATSATTSRVPRAEQASRPDSDADVAAVPTTATSARGKTGIPIGRRWRALAAAAATVLLIFVAIGAVRKAFSGVTRNPLVVLAVEKPGSGASPSLIPLALGCPVGHERRQFVLTTAEVASEIADHPELDFVALALSGAGDRPVTPLPLAPSRILVHKVYPVARALNDPEEISFSVPFFDLALVEIEGHLPHTLHAASREEVTAIAVGETVHCWTVSEAMDLLLSNRGGVQIPAAWAAASAVKTHVQHKTPLAPEAGARELLELDLQAGRCGAGSVLVNRRGQLVGICTTPGGENVEPGRAARLAMATPIDAEMIASVASPVDDSYWVRWQRSIPEDAP